MRIEAGLPPELGATMTADETQLQGGGPGSTFIQPCSQLGGKRKRNRQTRKASRKKRRKTKRAGSGVFDTVYNSIFGNQEKPPPKPKTSSDEFEVLDVDPSTAPWLAGPADGGYKGQGIGVPGRAVGGTVRRRAPLLV